MAGTNGSQEEPSGSLAGCLGASKRGDRSGWCSPCGVGLGAGLGARYTLHEAGKCFEQWLFTLVHTRHEEA